MSRPTDLKFISAIHGYFFGFFGVFFGVVLVFPIASTEFGACKLKNYSFKV
jgi:hypothetical protein